MLLLTDAQTPELKPLIALGEEAPKPELIRDAGSMSDLCRWRQRSDDAIQRRHGSMKGGYG